MAGSGYVPCVAVGSWPVPDVVGQVRADASSVGLGWRDLFVVSGTAGCEADDVTIGGHHLVLNADKIPHDLRVKVGRAFVRRVVVPGEMWFCPAGEAFTHRVATPTRFVQATLHPTRFARDVAGDRITLRRAYGEARPQLGHLVRSLAAEAERGGPSGSLFVEALATALATQIAGCFGSRALPAAQGLGDRALRRVIEFVRENLGTALSVDQMARQADLSPAHFTRAFKLSTGEAPHQFVMRCRLEEARRALEQPAPDLLNVALCSGFSDQAHLTRLFKRRYGVTPGQFVRGFGGRARLCRAEPPSVDRARGRTR